MTKNYRTLWNESLGAWVAAPEISKAKGKPNRSSVSTSPVSRRNAVVAALAMLTLGPPAAYATETDYSSSTTIASGTQVNNNVTLSGAGATLTNDGSISADSTDHLSTINVTGDNAVIENHGSILTPNGTGPDAIGVQGNNVVINNSGQITGSDSDGTSDAVEVRNFASGGSVTINNAAGGVMHGREATVDAVRMDGGNFSASPASPYKLNINNAGSMSSTSNDVFYDLINDQGLQWNVTNSGTITAGSTGYVARLGPGVNSLTLAPGSKITGIFDAGSSGQNLLSLGGDSNPANANAVFDISQVGADQQYQAFDRFSKTGASTWTLGGVNSAQPQSWQMEGGTLVVGKGTVLNGNIVSDTASKSGITVEMAGGTINAPSGSPAIGLVNDGDATLVMDNSNGPSVLNGGVKFGGSGAKTVDFSGSGSDSAKLDDYVGATQFAKDGSGSWTLSTASAQTGNWSVNQGNLVVAGQDVLGQGAVSLNGGSLALNDGVTVNNALSVAKGSSISTASGGTGTLAGVLSGTGDLSAIGGGTLNMNGDGSKYGGGLHVTGTTVNVNSGLAAGSVQVDQNSTLNVTSSLSSPTVNVDGTLSGIDGSTVNGNVTINSGGHLSPGGKGQIETMNVKGNLTLAAGANYDYDISAPGTSVGQPGRSDVVNVDGDLNVGGSKLNISSDSAGGAGYYRVADYTGNLSGTMEIGTTPAGYPTSVFVLDSSQKGKLDLVVGGGGATMHYWNGTTMQGDGTVHGGSGTWNDTNSNWTDQRGYVTAKTADSGNMIFKGTAGTVDVEGTRSFDSLQFVTSGYTFNGNGTLDLAAGKGNEVRVLDGETTIDTVIGGVGALNKTGDGTLILGGSNSYAGGTNLSRGTVKVSADQNLGAASGDLNFNGGALETSATMTTARNAHFGTEGGIFNVDDGSTLTESGTLDGSGPMSKDGKGTLILTGNNSYGDSQLLGGTTQISSASNLGSGSVTLDGGTLRNTADVALAGEINLGDKAGNGGFNVDGGTTLSLTNTVTGPGALVKQGDGTLVLGNGNNHYSGGTQLDGGVVRLDGSGSVAGTGAITANGGGLDFADGVKIGNDITLTKDLNANVNPVSAVAEEDGVISGPGGLTKTGDGTLILGGDNTYSGDTHVQSGTLEVNGDSSNSHFILDHGATIAGDGTLGSLDAHGTVSPAGDNGIGTLSIAHDLNLYQDSNYVVTAAPDGTADQIKAGGKATIDGAALDVLAQSGQYKPRTTYDILTAGGGVSGQFGSTKVNLPFLTASMTYDANNAYLTLTRNQVPFDNNGENQNEINAGKGLDQMEQKGDNALTDAVSALTAGDVPNALQQLSGESYASLQNAAENGSQDFMSGIWGHMGPAVSDQGAKCGPLDDGRHLWVSAPLAQTQVNGNRDVSAYTSRTWGVSMGADAEVAKNLTVGVAGGYLSTTQNNDTLHSKGTVNTGSMAVYSQYDVGSWWLGGTAGLGVGRLSNTRSISFPGYSATANGSAPVASAFAKFGGGYRIPTRVGTLEPLASVDVTTTRIGDLSETGGKDANLNVSGTTQTSVASELGARFTHAFALASGREGAFDVSVAWRHQLKTPANTVSAGFVTGQTALLTYQGWQPPKDSAVVGLGLKVDVSKSSQVSLDYQGEFGSGQKSNALTGQYQYHW
jgi:autotransporter-associated beta strand protein